MFHYSLAAAAALLSCSLVLLASAQTTPSLRLVDGLNSCQGRLEIMPSTSSAFGQACDLDAGDNEAQVICRQLGCQATGATRVDPITYGFSAAINSYAAFGFTCTGNEADLSACTPQGASCSTDNPSFAIAVECGGQVGPNLRLVDGSSRCHGRVEFRPSSSDSFGQACDLDVGNTEAQVICRELGCNPTGARRVNPTNYGFSAAVNSYRAFGFTCNGNENALSSCSPSGATCQVDSVDHALAVECGGAAPELVLLDLVGGQVGCKGLLIYRPTSTERFGVACDLDVSNNEAQVICRELPGCNPVGATRANPTTFGFSTAINAYRGFSYTCNGSEAFLSNCTASATVCVTDSASHAVAIQCGGA